MAKEKSADVTLSEASQELTNLNARLSDAGARRDKLLQFFADDKALDTIEAEITVLRRQHERQAARVKLFEKQVEQEQVEAALKRRKEQSVSPDGAALSGIAVKALLMHEIYRVGARPFVGGSPGELKQVDLPGGQSPRHELLGQPDKIEPFGARMRRASKAAIEVMKGKIPEIATALPSADAGVPPSPSGNGAPPSTPSPEPSANGDQQTLAALLKRQAQLAEDMTPAGEAAYQEVVRQIAALQ
jgi:hypothetical protein